MEGGPFSQAGRPVAASDLVLSMTVSIASFTDFQRFVSDNRRRLRPGGSRGNLPEPGSRSRATTEEVPHCIAALTFLDPPAQSRASFVIGRDPNRCDIVCANPPVGNEHFQLGFVGDHLVLSDVSVRGSKIYLDGCGLHRTWPTPETPYRCFLPPGCEAVLNIPGYEFKFTVRAREGAELDEFRRKRAAFLATTSPIGRLILASQTTTQAPSASLSPLPDPGNKLKYMYWFESDLGRGGQGVVHQVRRLQDWEPFAAKHVLERSRQRTSKSDKEFESESQRLKQEMSTLQALEHKHIVKYVDWYNDGNDRWHLIMELCPLGSLQAMIGNATVVFSRRMIAEMLQQVAGGLHYLHGKGVAHRDLKPGNILVRSLNPLSLALCDFGLAKQSVRDDGAMTTHCGTRPFMAPEMWTAGRYTREVDIWALGIVGAMLLRIAFPRLSPNAPHSQYPKLIRERVITMRNADRDDEVVALVARMLAWDPRDRPSAKECLEDATEILKALRRPQPAAPRSGAAPSLATLPPPPPPPLSMSSGSGTPFRSSEVRAMERELQFSTLRRPGFVAASQKRDTTALPRSNSMEAPAPKQVRTDDQRARTGNGPGPGPQPGNYSYAPSQVVTQVRRDTTLAPRSGLLSMPQNGPGIGPGVGRGAGPGVGRGAGPGVGRGAGPEVGRGAGSRVGPRLGPGAGRGLDRGVGYGPLSEISRHDEKTLRENTVRGNGGRGNSSENGSGNGDGGIRNEPQRKASSGWLSSLSRVRDRAPISSSIVSEEE